MELSFSPGARSLVSSASLSPHFHLPNTTIIPGRRQILHGCCGNQLSSPRRRWNRHRRPEAQILNPRCSFQDSLLDNSALLVAIAALQLLYLSYTTRRMRRETECSDQEFSNSMNSFELHKQDTETRKHEIVQSQFLGIEGPGTESFLYEINNIVPRSEENLSSKEVHACHTKHEDHKLQPGLSLTDADRSFAKSSETNLLNPVTVSTVDVITQDDYPVEMPDLLLGKLDDPVPVSNLPEMMFGHTFSCFSNTVRKNQREYNKHSNLEHIKTEDSEFLVSGYDRILEVSSSPEEKLPDLSSISCFKSFSSEPVHLTLPEKIGSYTLRSAWKVADVPEPVSHLNSEQMEGPGPIAYFKERSGTKERGYIKVSYSTNMSSNLLHKHGNTKFSGFHQPNRNVVKDDCDPPGYLRTFHSFLSDSRLKDCADLLESMERKGLLDMEKVHHTRFLKACKSQRAVKEAFRFCKLIKKPTLSTFNMLLSVCANSQDFDGAFQAMLLVKEAGLRPDCKLYTTLISTCAKCGKVDAMFEVFHEMVNAGVEPNVNTYGALIDGCARAGQVAKAFGAYGIMRSKKVEPDRVVFNALITACGQSGAVDRAFDVLSEMMSEPQPIHPDHVTVGALIKTCSQAGQVDRVREVYKMLQLYNIKGTPYVYTIAVRSCSQTGDLEFALNIYEDMKRNGIVPDEMFLSTFIDVAGHAEKVHAAFDILEDARNKGVKLGNMSYSSLMGACCNAKNWQKALELYEDIKSINLIPTVSLLNALITSLCDGDQLHKSVEVIDEMREAGVLPNEVTYIILIVACEKKGEAELGLSLLSKAKMDGILPNLIICRCLTGLCLQSFEKAYSLGEPVVSFDSGRPQIENKWTSCAIMVYRQTIAAGVIPSIEVFSQVLGCLQFPRDSLLRSRFIENLGISFDPLRYTNVCSLLDGFGEYDTRCFSILEEAASLGVVPRVSIKDSPIVVDAKKLNIHTIEVYLLTILKGLKHRLAAGARLPNITIVLPVERVLMKSAEGEKPINLSGRIGQTVTSLLRRLGLYYHGDESFGKIRINGITLRRWFKPNLTISSFDGRLTEMIPAEMRLSKGIFEQQRSIRNNSNLSFFESNSNMPLNYTMDA